VQTLAEDLILLSIRPGNGMLAAKAGLGYALRGAELVRLAATGRVEITGGRIIVLDAGPTGDPRLDAALASIVKHKRPPQAKAWVGAGGAGDAIRKAYLDRLIAAGTVRRDREVVFRFIPVLRWRVCDAALVADLRARLDAIVYASGQVDLEQAAFAGLVSAAGLGSYLYPGWEDRRLRRRLKQIATGEWTTPGKADREPAEMESGTDAPTHAAVSAAVHAATHAAVSAAVHAAHHAATEGGHGGHGGGGHGGH